MPSVTHILDVLNLDRNPTGLQTVAQNMAQLDYMRHAMKSKDAEIDVLKKKWQEYQEVQDRLSGYEKDRLGEKDLLRKRAEQIDALQHKVNPDCNRCPVTKSR